jgi:plastocyanin
MTATISGRLLGLLAAALLAAALLAGCTSAAGITGPPPTAPPGGAVIVAQGIAFDRAQLVVPAGTSFALLFENRDGALHNVTIYDDAGGQPMFVGEVFTGPGSRTYAVPAIPAGTHRFRCDVHPQMSGTLEAGPG